MTIKNFSMACCTLNSWLGLPKINDNQPLSDQPLNGPKKMLVLAQAGLTACGVNKVTALGTWILLGLRGFLDLVDDNAIHHPELEKKNYRTLTRGALLALGSEFPGAAATITAVLAVLKPDQLISKETRAWLENRVTKLPLLSA